MNYRTYEILRNMDLEQSKIQTLEFQNFFKVYPRIAASILLEKKIELLNKKLKLEKKLNSKNKIRREINSTKVKLGKNKLLKKIHGDDKVEAKFLKKIKERESKINKFPFFEKGKRVYEKPHFNLKKSFNQRMYKYLPPSLFSLKELIVSEKGLLLKQWLEEKNPTNP
jgi:hypothetical protein